MLFNSYIFIFVFLPVVLFIYYAILGKGRKTEAIAWLVASSMFFYGWWNPSYLGLIVASIIFNYSIGVSLNNKPAKAVLIMGVGFNVLLLGYFKYANFFIDNLNTVFSYDIVTIEVVLPLAISFFTFQQIAYLVDVYRGNVKEHNFLHYCLFVTFFPQLIAGPIVHHKEMLPQFRKGIFIRFDNLSVGFTIFIIGLFKKVILADGLGSYASPVFDASSVGEYITFFESWVGALSYTLQLYFDFSGYSDMAIGIARMFGIILPANFNSPYKSNSIIEFWERWHITLSRFLKDYIYISLGGNRKGSGMKAVNIMITMLLGGLWHGAGWTFIVWGGIHGIYIMINHLWRHVCSYFYKGDNHSISWNVVSKVITLIAVIIGWVFFRSDNLDGAVNLLKSMFLFDGLSFPEVYRYKFGIGEYIDLLNFSGKKHIFLSIKEGVILLSISILIAIFMPNTQQIMEGYNPVLRDIYKSPKGKFYTWRPTVAYAIIISLVFVFIISYLSRVTEFLYFQF
jgi:D-alanyl-lipoteichoic acid acyltransferase DltB (MBOAT superfamily)